MAEGIQPGAWRCKVPCSASLAALSKLGMEVDRVTSDMTLQNSVANHEIYCKTRWILYMLWLSGHNGAAVMCSDARVQQGMRLPGASCVQCVSGGNRTALFSSPGMQSCRPTKALLDLEGRLLVLRYPTKLHWVLNSNMQGLCLQGSKQRAGS